MYKKGIETKQQIIDEAKRLFYVKGFKKATVNEICENCNVKLGTFTYYFKKKEDLLNNVYGSYMTDCYNYVKEKTQGLSGLDMHLYTIMLYYFNIYRDVHVARFHKDVLLNGEMNYVFRTPRELIINFTENGDIAVDSEVYELMIIADNAMRREINLRFMKEDDFSLERVRDLVRNLYIVTGRLGHMDGDSINKGIDDAYEFVTQHLNAPVGLLQ